MYFRSEIMYREGSSIDGVFLVKRIVYVEIGHVIIPLS